MAELQTALTALIKSDDGLEFPIDSLSRAQKIGEFLAIGHFGFDAQKVVHEIDDGAWDGNAEQAKQSQNDHTALPFVSGDFIHS
jgi:hypothetical protein